MRYLVASILLVVGGAAGTARADSDSGDAPPASASDLTISAGTFARWYHSTSAASLTPDAMFGPQFTVGWHVVGLGGPRHGMQLSIVGDLAGGSSSGEIFQTLPTHIDQLILAAGPRLELDVWRGISAAAQLTLGAGRTRVTVGDTTYDMALVDDTVWHALGTASIGLGYNRHIRRRFTLALFVDLGWTFTQSINVHANPQSHPDPDLSIDTVYASLGDLDTGGITGSTTIRFGF